MVVSATGKQTVTGQEFLRIEGFPGGDVFLRFTEEGALVAWDPETRRERVWVDFSAREGSSYETAIDPCNRRATVSARAGRYSGPIGQFTNAFLIAYPALQCADAGLNGEAWLPGVGLVQRRMSTIAGEIPYDLVYARLGSATVVTGPEVSFTLAFDRAVYPSGRMASGVPPYATARMTLRNTLEGPIRLVFPSGQSFELVLRNERGDIVYRWSDGMGFTMAIREEDFRPGERSYVVAIPLAAAGQPFLAGRYFAEAWLTTTPRTYAASSGFEIRNIE